MLLKLRIKKIHPLIEVKKMKQTVKQATNFKSNPAKRKKRPKKVENAVCSILGNEIGEGSLSKGRRNSRTRWNRARDLAGDGTFVGKVEGTCL